jgi:hypothetical protein
MSRERVRDKQACAITRKNEKLLACAHQIIIGQKKHEQNFVIDLSLTFSCISSVLKSHRVLFNLQTSTHFIVTLLSIDLATGILNLFCIVVATQQDDDWEYVIICSDLTAEHDKR